MDFANTLEQEALRRELRAFIAEHFTPEVMAEMEGHNEGPLGAMRASSRGPVARELFRKFYERGPGCRDQVLRHLAHFARP